MVDWSKFIIRDQNFAKQCLFLLTVPDYCLRMHNRLLLLEEALPQSLEKIWDRLITYIYRCLTSFCDSQPSNLWTILFFLIYLFVFKVDVLNDHSLLIDGSGLISKIVPSGPETEQLIRSLNSSGGVSRVVDCKGKVVLPGFVDGHTHSVFDGDRSHEHAMKLAGATYEEVNFICH